MAKTSPMVLRLIISESDGQVTVLAEEPGGDSPFAAAAVPFQVNFDTDDVEDLRWYLEDYLYAPYGAYSERGEIVERRLEEWGEELFPSC